MANSQLNPADRDLHIGRSVDAKAVRRILVGIAADKQSESTVTFAARLAQQLNAEVILLHVFSTGYSTGPDIVFSELEQRAICIRDATALLEAVRLRLMPEINADMIVREGEPSAEIVNAANDSNADLIVIGKPAHGWLTRTMLGSVTASVVRHATCPVLTVPCRP